MTQKPIKQPYIAWLTVAQTPVWWVHAPEGGLGGAEMRFKESRTKSWNSNLTISKPQEPPRFAKSEKTGFFGPGTIF